MNKSIPLKKISENVADEFDILICSASYEVERCTEIAKHLKENAFKHKFVCYNEDVHERAGASIKLFSKYFSDNHEKIELSKKNPVQTADNLLNAFDKLSVSKISNAKCLVDVTCFTHEGLLILYKVLKIMKWDVTYVYVPAEYGPKSDLKNIWLSKGTGEIRSILGYPGKRNPSKNAHLIVLVGFEVERAEKLINKYEPASLSIGKGNETGSVSPKAYQINTKRCGEIKKKFPHAHEFTFSPTDCEDVKTKIIEQAKAIPEHNVIVAPMNTKISTLGIAMAADENDAIQVCYARANIYNVEDYSLPMDCCIMFRSF